MAELPDVTGGETIASAYTSAVKNRTVMRYSSAAARDTSIPAPVAGNLAYLQDSDTVTYYDGTVWQTVQGEAAAGLTYLALSGGAMTGNINMGDNKLTVVEAGTSSTDGVNKGQLDQAVKLTPAGDQTITTGNLRLGGGGYINAYDTSPPDGGDLFNFQTRNIIASDTAPTGGDGKDGDIYVHYTFNTATRGADVYIKVSGTWRGQD